ncbi:M20/M25/M40 family metallo-hydrolase [Terrilactibacillus sp. S3-3]|nr:M20/M25/M40 family metallo-hydrolase [Terrilactibacillus sp. S3-3]
MDGRIYGRGAGDMKSGLIAIVAAMIQLKEEGVPLKGAIKFIATVGRRGNIVNRRQTAGEMGGPPMISMPL